VKEYRLALVVFALAGMALGAAVPMSFLVPLSSQLRSAQLALSEFERLTAELEVDKTAKVLTAKAASCGEAMGLPGGALHKE